MEEPMPGVDTLIKQLRILAEDARTYELPIFAIALDEAADALIQKGAEIARMRAGWDETFYALAAHKKRADKAEAALASLQQARGMF
jgi:hypothetical protein